MLSPAIDPFWHSHILHTREYAEFCQKACGQFLHHLPLDHDDVDAVDAIAELYEYTAGVYEKVFSYINPTFFPKVMAKEFLICGHGNLIDTELGNDALFEKDHDLVTIEI